LLFWEYLQNLPAGSLPSKRLSLFKDKSREGRKPTICYFKEYGGFGPGTGEHQSTID